MALTQRIDGRVTIRRLASGFARPTVRTVLTLLVALVVLTGLAMAQDRPDRSGSLTATPMPSAIVEVVSPHAPIVSAPRRGATRRGTLAFRSRFDAHGRVLGDGCASGAYVDLGSRRYVCEEYIEYTSEPASASPQPAVRPGEILPFRYAFVRFDGTPGYGRPEDYFVGDFLESYGEGFGLVVTSQRVVDGIGFLRLRRGTYVTDDSVRFARGSDFQGVRLEGDAALAWVRTNATPLRSRPTGRIVRRLGRRDLVHVAAIEGTNARLAEGGFVRVADLNRVVVTDPPVGIGERERWIDVSVTEQVLIAYEGRTPRFATLVSTGADRAGSATPLGEFRIWAKLATSDMDDLERQDVASNYLIEGVPWVQYFDGSNALHAAFWHDDFGKRRSHGCVNLAPTDARFLYTFTQPDVPPGFEAVVPFTDESRTLVRVRQ